MNLSHIDFLHVHDRVKRTLCFSPTDGDRLDQYARRYLLENSPAVFAPAVGAFLTTVVDYRVPVAVGLLLIVSSDLERKCFAVFKCGAAIDAETVLVKRKSDFLITYYLETAHQASQWLEA